MSWIGLRDRKSGYFNDAGLGAVSKDAVDLNSILPVGSVLMSFSVRSAHLGRRTTLVKQSADSPWHSAFGLTLTECGGIAFHQLLGAQACSAYVPAGLQSRTDEVLLTYTWNAPARRAMLSVENGDTGQVFSVEITNPLPLSLRDAIWMSRHPDGCQLVSSYDFLAVADHEMPHGSLPSLDRTALVPTPYGLAQAGSLKPGDLVLAADGHATQLRWAGSVEVPSRGRFAPVTARAPFFGTTRDLMVASHQRLELVGTEVEYLFASERVSVRCADLPAKVVKAAPSRRLTQTYCQFVLDRPATINIGGYRIEPLCVEAIGKNARLRAHSVLKHLPREMLPMNSGSKIERLKRLETLTLCGLIAA